MKPSQAPKPKTETVLAKEFARILRVQLSRQELAQVIAKNKENDDKCCASHNFLDANVTMAEAFLNVVGHRPDVSGDSNKSDKDIALWVNAWSIAKKENFYVTEKAIVEKKEPFTKEGDFVVGPENYRVEAEGGIGDMLVRDLNKAFAMGKAEGKIETEKKYDLTKALDEAAAPVVEKRLGVDLENTGGNVMCFVFYGKDNGKTTDLYFGWANGGIGYCLMSDDGATLVESDDLAEDSDADDQVDFIVKHCERLGFKIQNPHTAITPPSAKAEVR